MLRHNVTNLVDNVAEVALVWGSCNTRRIFLETIEGERKGESAACRAVARQKPSAAAGSRPGSQTPTAHKIVGCTV
jgi:hypothetical protein